MKHIIGLLVRTNHVNINVNSYATHIMKFQHVSANIFLKINDYIIRILVMYCVSINATTYAAHIMKFQHVGPIIFLEIEDFLFLIPTFPHLPPPSLILKRFSYFTRGFLQ